ncbi:MAG: hypothetical protein HQL15_05460 [Candidatus Omnitrophica bacterium]|nr:hypothetical protein [Candidatus Omnitrophota bacterium]
MKVNDLKMFVAVGAVMLMASGQVRAAEEANVRHISGEITWIDLKAGELQLERDQSPRTGEVTEYRLTEYETRVKNPSDDKFLSVKDLQAGQHVTVDVVNGKEDKIVQRITADPMPVSEYQEAYGQINAVNIQDGTLTLAVRLKEGETGEDKSYFVFDTKDVIVMQSSTRAPIPLELKVGDVVKILFVVKDGKRQVHSITLYSPRVTSSSTTTTTTVTTTP